MAREKFDNLRIMAVNSEINDDNFLKIIKICGQTCFNSDDFSIILFEEENKLIYYSTMKFLDVINDFLII